MEGIKCDTIHNNAHTFIPVMVVVRTVRPVFRYASRKRRINDIDIAVACRAR